MPYFMCNEVDANGKCCPTIFHPTPQCMAIFRNGNRFGIWQQIHDQVRQQLRTELGKDKQSTVAIADSQSVKTTEKKGRSTVSMVARRLKDVNAILL